MFTAAQLIAAHGKVKTGADFPAYIHEIKNMGVTHYECYVSDGHIDYHGAGRHTVTIPAKYAPLTIADTAHPENFEAALKAHQQGLSDFYGFISAIAAHGIAGWSISTSDMTCTYHDKSGHAVLTEQIPEAGAS